MTKLRLTFACWDYDRTRALAEGTVRPDGIDLVYLAQPVEETFFRMLRYREFDACEMSLSSYVASLGQDHPAFVAIPAFPSRFFRHSCIFISTGSGIRKPQELKGKRIGVPEYQMTAPVWIMLNVPPTISLRAIPSDKTLSRMLADGELDALVTARAPSTFHKEPDKVQRLFPNYVEMEKDYYRRTRIFPIMHTVVLRRDVYERNPWIAQSLYKACVASKAKAYELYNQTAAMPSMLPWTVAHVEEARREMGEDWWSYGLSPNRQVLDTFLRYHHEQGLSKRRFAPEELFAKETLESYKV